MSLYSDVLYMSKLYAHIYNTCIVIIIIATVALITTADLSLIIMILNTLIKTYKQS